MLPVALCLSLLAQTPATPGIKIAVPALAVIGIDDKLGDFYASHLSQQLHYRGVGTLTNTEIAALLGIERQQALLGCPNDSCKTDLLGGLGIDGVVIGRVTKLDKSFQLDVRILSVGSGETRVLAAASANTEDQDRLVGVFTVVAAQLANELSVKLGRPLSTPGGAEVVLTASKVKRRSWAPLAAGVVVAGVGAAFLVLAKGSASSLMQPRMGADRLDQATTEAIARNGSTQQTVGWALVGVSGACLVAAAAMFLLGGNDVVQGGIALTPYGASFGISGWLPW